MSKFRKKPVEIEARRVGDEAWQKLAGWCGGEIIRKSNGRSFHGILISTLEGKMLATHADWIICGVAGEFYPCKPDIFEATYEAVAESLP